MTEMVWGMWPTATSLVGDLPWLGLQLRVDRGAARGVPATVGEGVGRIVKWAPESRCWRTGQWGDLAATEAGTRSWKALLKEFQ